MLASKQAFAAFCENGARIIQPGRGPLNNNNIIASPHLASYLIGTNEVVTSAIDALLH